MRETEWISWLFMIGSACFAVASIPMLAAAVPAGVIGTTYFVGSLFFTTASVLVAASTLRDVRAQERSRSPARTVLHSIDWWAALIQVAGTLWFNINTYDAMQDGLTTHQENLRVWTPDFLGSVCFLVSSYLSLWSVCRRPWCLRRDSGEWQIAALNLLGSLLFMAAALAAFVLPSTGDPLDASLANSGTLTGALCFLVGARLLTRTGAVLPTANAGELSPTVR
jgi:hypothetical protein